MPAPLRIFVVEDEMAIALLIEDMLADLGHQVAGLAMRLPQAMEAAKTVSADLAILDINLDGRKSFPVAQVLQDRGIPFLFASGYGARGLEPPFDSMKVLQKPFELRDLKAAVESAAP
jgi:DNA-binding response OmpR family regulator